MRKLNNYIARTVIGAVGMVLLVIVSLDAIAALVDQLGELKGDYDFLQALIYVGFTLPGRIYENIPFSALVGCLVGLGILAGSSELVVMRAAGVSLAQITWAVMKPVLLFIALSIGLGEYVTPLTDQIAESRRAIAQGDKNALESRHGLWNRDGNEFMHINAVLPNGRLYGVTRYRFDDEGKLLAASFADTAMFRKDYWVEEDGRESVITDKGIETHTYHSRRWDTSLSPSLLNVLVLEPDALSIQNLYSYSSYLEQQGIENNQYELAFWKKLLQPLATASLVLIAVSFIFGPLREVTMGYRIFTGVIVGIVFRMSQDLLGPSSLVFGFSPLLAVLVPLLVCAVIGVYLLRKAN
ncbi:LPS export ABC transporter permease LptG [Aestuariicella sp. G3-2]|uniref:LPS export ABC transporter permease LptG n=1 Tax=Pseudomaricurvus albidus TaxID=2842452 RepID=UPI001C0D0C0B|nr:LPS export ABC transporter permease LptG [Aestuariicella albida]MBU3069477.1 LPS export ABC transporter permease LptG [Aestuariicella albida]